LVERGVVILYVLDICHASVVGCLGLMGWIPALCSWLYMYNIVLWVVLYSIFWALPCKFLTYCGLFWAMCFRMNSRAVTPSVNLLPSYIEHRLKLGGNL
jgi:hypothetical protein